MDPTNDPEILKTYNRECYEMCPKCFRSLCLSQGHQEWSCRCGHRRLDHLDQWDYYNGPPGYKHPHPCLLADCDCEGLVYMVASDFLTNEEVISALLGFIEEYTS